MDSAGGRKMDAFELSASVCVLMAFLGTKYSSFAKQAFAAMSSAEFFGERRKKALGHIERLCPERKCPLP